MANETAIEVQGFAVAGTPYAFELFGPHEEMTCRQCGAQLSNVYATSLGPMGGDCLATLTGDNATRSAVRRARAAFSKVGHLGRITLLGLDVEKSSCTRAWAARAYVAGCGWKAFGFANTPADRARWEMILVAIAQEIGAEVVAVPADAPSYRRPETW